MDDIILDAILQDSIGNTPLKNSLGNFDSKFLDSLWDYNNNQNLL